MPLYAWSDREMHQKATDAAREVLGERAWKEARDEGRTMTFEEAVTHTLGEDQTPFPSNRRERPTLHLVRPRSLPYNYEGY